MAVNFSPRSNILSGSYYAAAPERHSLDRVRRRIVVPPVYPRLKSCDTYRG